VNHDHRGRGQTNHAREHAKGKTRLRTRPRRWRSRNGAQGDRGYHPGDEPHQGTGESIADMVVRLTNRSQAIGEIIATVNDLAEQSNFWPSMPPRSSQGRRQERVCRRRPGDPESGCAVKQATTQSATSFRRPEGDQLGRHGN